MKNPELDAAPNEASDDTFQMNLDEQARAAALKYAATVMHYVRRETAAWNFTDATESWMKQTVTYHGHLGKPPKRIDQLAQVRLEEAFKLDPPSPLLGTAMLLGEEAQIPAWDPSQTGRSTIFRADPIDGTAALVHSGDGFSTVITVESRRDAGQPWKHFGGAIVRSDGLALSWSRRATYGHSVQLDTSQEFGLDEGVDLADLGSLPPLPSRDIDEVMRRNIARSGAAVAAQSSLRRESLLANYGRLIAAAEYFDFRAGSPAAWPLCMGMLGWVIEPNATTIHDSIHLYPYSILLGGHVVDLQRRPINVAKTIEDHAGPESLEKVFPPYVAYFDAESLDFVFDNAGAFGF